MSPAALPVSTQVRDLVVSLGAVVLGALGTTDGALPQIVRAEVPALSALVLAIVAICHHQTLQGALAASQAAVDGVQAAGRLPGAPQGVAVAGASLDQALAAVGAYLETNRAGVVATADNGRHTAPVSVPAPAVPLDQAVTDVLAAVPLPPVPPRS